MGRHRSRRAGGAVLTIVAGLVMAGCSGDAGDAARGQSTPPVPPVSASASPSPTSTLSPEEQQAFEEATATALAYRQTIADLYSGARTDLNDLDKVATGDLLDASLKGVQQGLSQGYRSEPQGVLLAISSAEPLSVELEANPPTVIVKACIDARALIDVGPSEDRTPGLRELSDYTVVKTDYLPGTGWAVARVSGAEDAEDRKC
jgi:hypothetical protein